MTVRVLIADDHPVVRAGVTALLDTDPDIEIVATAATPSEALAATADRKSTRLNSSHIQKSRMPSSA